MNKTKNRTKQTGEVFTPSSLVEEMLSKLELSPDKTYLDNSCGNGQFLSALFKHNIPLHNIYGVDLMADNVADTIARLAVLEKYNLDIINESAQFKINYPEYADNHDYNWLESNHSSFSRHYHGTLNSIDIDITITFEYFDSGNAGVFRYTFSDGTSNTNPNIVCHNALTYDYSFDKPKKSIIEF